MAGYVDIFLERFHGDDPRLFAELRDGEILGSQPENGFFLGVGDPNQNLALLKNALQGNNAFRMD